MMEIIDALKKRLDYQQVLLDRLIKNRKKFNGIPKGVLRTSKKRQTYQYYFREESSDSYRYMPVEKRELVKAIIQRAYEEKMIYDLKKDCDNLKKILELYSPPMVEAEYENLPESRKLLAEPVTETKEMYMERWYRNYPGNMNKFPEKAQFKTDRGEYVRSKSEKIIADLLYKLEIPYQYEPVIRLKNGHCVYPDFAVLNVRTRKTYFWEHLGMIDDENYASKNLEKILNYEKEGIFPGDMLLLTEETAQCPLDMDVVNEIIHKYLI